MAIPCIHGDHGIPKTYLLIVHILRHIQDALDLILPYLGLQASPVTVEVDPLPLPAPTPPWINPRRSMAIKSKLPVVEFAETLCGRGDDEHECPVCLARMEAKDEVRELGNCAHAFHMRCIDGWIDAGRSTCPLCRSRLLRCSL